MDRIAWLLIAAGMLAGCQPQVPLENPFMPQTTVPPPGTAGTAGAPLYTPPPMQLAPSTTPSAMPAAPTTIAPAPAATMPGTLPTTPPATQTPYYPPGGTFDFRQGSTERPGKAVLAAESDPMPETAALEVATAAPPKAQAAVNNSEEPELFAALTQPQNAFSRDRVTRWNQAAGAGDAAEEFSAPAANVDSVAAAEPRSVSTIRVVEAPRAGADMSGRWSPSREETSNRLAASSAAEPSTTPHLQTAAHANTAAAAASGIALAAYHEPAAIPATAASSRGEYGHSTDYQRLSGSLEYSHATRQWKLRYIPIDGQTDAYGGSVVIADGAALEGFRPGEFVTVEGEIVSEKTASSRFAPKYQVRRVAPQR
jgi:hypothetical protein